MSNSLRQYTEDHRYLLDLIRRDVGIADPVALDVSVFYEPLLKAARKGPVLPLDGVLVRHWDESKPRFHQGVQLGLRLYEIEGIRFVRVCLPYANDVNCWGCNFTAVDRKDYHRLFRIALRCRADQEPPTQPPVLPAEQIDLLWKNTIGYLDSANLLKIKGYGGRARRGILLTGAPGNGKTMACRWIWEECRRRHWEWHLVTPDVYRQARSCGTVEDLFSVEGRGIIFFDDMDQALRDRETVHETEDQTVFLSNMDGMSVNEGVVFVFTTNCGLDLIDRAFKRPGRIDVVLEFKLPDANLRQQLIDRWHADIRANIDPDLAVTTTEGYSFAEVEELKNLLVMHFLDQGKWDWDRALEQFDLNRRELNGHNRTRRVGFSAGEAVLNGSGNGR